MKYKNESRKKFEEALSEAWKYIGPVNFNLNNQGKYEDTLHYQFKERRRQIAERINTAIAQNQDCYIAYWVKQNSDKNLDDYTLVHGIKGEYHTL